MKCKDANRLIPVPQSKSLLVARQQQEPGIRKGRQPIARGLGRLPKSSFYFIFPKQYCLPSSKGDRKGRPYRIALPHVYRAMIILKQVSYGGAGATVRRRWPGRACVPCSVDSRVALVLRRGVDSRVAHVYRAV